VGSVILRRREKKIKRLKKLCGKNTDPTPAPPLQVRGGIRKDSKLKHI
jgi:hypothetical protein